MLRRICGTLYFQVIVAILLGALLGVYAPAAGISMKAFGDGYIKLIKMIIAPIIFCTLSVGIAGASSMKKVGTTGSLALLYFEVMSTIALIIGLMIVNFARPGSAMNVDVRALDTTPVAAYTTAGKAQSAKEFLLNIIPLTFFDAFATGDILQVLLLSILFGVGLRFSGGAESLVYQLLERVSAVVFAIVGLLSRAAPIGAFGAMAFTVGAYGIASLASLAKLIGCFYLTCVCFVVVVLGGFLRLYGLNIFLFLRYIRDELLIVLGTSSSETALPPLMTKLEDLGVSRSTVALVVPAGYSFNLDGTAIYLTMALVFIAQATNTHLTLDQQLSALAVLLLTSKGAAGVTGSGFIVLAATLSATHSVPLAGLTLLLGIDRFMSEARALTNVIGNAVACLVIAQWTGDAELKSVRKRLSGEFVAVRMDEMEVAPAGK